MRTDWSKKNQKKKKRNKYVNFSNMDPLRTSNTTKRSGTFLPKW